MSNEKRAAEACRWLITARDDLDAAHLLYSKGMYSLACFHTQQAAEKAVKALHYFAGLDPWGHSVAKLINDLKDRAPDIYKRAGLNAEEYVRLDLFYIPTRYPNGVPDLAPSQVFRSKDAEEGISLAGSIINNVENIIKHG